MQSTVLSIKGLSKHLGSRLILDDISVEVGSGEIFGFIGPNGSGKTTTIKVMLGLLSLEAGEVCICGHSIKKEFCAAMSNVGGIIENPELYKYLTGFENLMQYSRMQGGITKERIDEVTALVRLTDRINDKVAKYSLGVRQRLGLAQALLSRPRLLVLDEPTNGLDPAGIHELREILLKVSHEEGTAVFISSHQLAELDLMCDRIAVIDKGRVIAVRSMEEVRRSGQTDIEEFEFETVAPAAEAAELVMRRLKNAYTLDGAKFSVRAALADGGHGLTDSVRELVMAGVPILAAIPLRHSLEDAFLEIIGGPTSVTKDIPTQYAPVEPTQSIGFIPPSTSGGDAR